MPRAKAAVFGFSLYLRHRRILARFGREEGHATHSRRLQRLLNQFAVARWGEVPADDDPRPEWAL